MEFLPKCFRGSASTPTRTRPSATIEELCHRFSLSQLRESTDNFDPSLMIGGGYGSDVYQGRTSISGEPKETAVKRFRSHSRQGRFEFENEILMMCQLHHPNLVSLVGFCDDKQEMIVVYEYMPYRSLDHYLHGRDSNSPVLSWKKRLEISIGTARALHYLHSGTKRTIIHRDVKSSNILLDENWMSKLSGFGSSLKGQKFSSKSTKPIEGPLAGTLGYLDPNYVYSSMVTYKCDIYSFGVVLLELLCGKKPFERFGQINNQASENKDEGRYSLLVEEVKNSVETGDVEKIIDPKLVGEIATECCKLYMDIALSCISMDLDERPDMGEVELELERVLELQHQADANPHFYAFF